MKAQAPRLLQVNEPPVPTVPGRSHGQARRVQWCLLGFTAALFAYHVVTSRRFLGPGIFDEAGYLGNARNLIDATPIWKMGDAPFYRSAYSLFILPAELFGSVADRYRAALAINALLLAALAPMLYVLTRRLTRCPPGAALAGSAVAATLPAVLMWSKMAMTEALAIAGFTATVGALWFTATDRPAWQRLAFGPLLALLYGTHGRFLPVVVLGFLALAVVGWAHGSWRTPFTNVLLAGGGIAGFMALHAHLKGLRWTSVRWDTAAGGHSVQTVTNLKDVLELVSSGSEVRALLGAIIGQSWYLMATTFGLVAFGLMALLVHTAGTPPHRGYHAGAGAGEDSARLPIGLTRVRAALSEEPSRIVAGFALLSCLALFTTSWLFLFRWNLRPDFFVYGRYNETCVPLLVALGIGALLRDGNRRLVLAGLGLASLVLASGLVELVLIRTADRYSGTPGGWNTVNIFGIFPFIEAETRAGPNPDYRTVLQTVTFASSAGTLILAAVALAAAGKRWGVALVTIVCLAASLPAGRADLVLFGDYIDGLYGNFNLPARLASMGSPEKIAFDIWEGRPARDLTPWHGYQFSLPDTEVIGFDSSKESIPEVPVVLAPFDWAAGLARGARLALAENSFRRGVWVMPGQLQDRMAAEGRLLPADYDGRLPEPARRGSVELLGQPPRLTIKSGEKTTLKMQVRHLGEKAPWLAGPVPVKGRMAVSAAWRPPAGEPIDSHLGWAGLGELPHSLWPGETTQVEFPIHAVDDTGNGLAPGDYRITIELHEVGISSLSSPSTAPITIAVRITG